MLRVSNQPNKRPLETSTETGTPLRAVKPGSQNSRREYAIHRIMIKSYTSLKELTANQRIEMAKWCCVIEIYGPVTAYYNKFGERIQEWDEYGKKMAAKQGEAEGLVSVVSGSDEAQALAAVESYKQAGNTVTRIEIL